MNNQDFWHSIHSIIDEGFTANGLSKLESYAEQFITQRLVYKRFSSAKQYGSSKGGATHVIAPLHSRAKTEADRGVPQELLFKEEFDIRINTPKLRCRGIRSLTTEVEIKQ